MASRNLCSLLCLLALAWSAGCTQEYSPSADSWDHHKQGLPFIVGYAQGEAEVQASGKPGMFFVTTTWCPPCKEFAEDCLSDPKVQEMLSDFVLVIVDGDTDIAGMDALGAERKFPEIIFRNANGEKLASFLGPRTVSQFKELIEEALAK